MKEKEAGHSSSSGGYSGYGGYGPAGGASGGSRGYGYDGDNQGAGQNPYGDFGGFWGFGPFGFGGYSNSGYNQDNPENMGDDETGRHLKAAVNYINSGAYEEAINVLNGIDNRDSRWYYYSAKANSGAGNTATALEHAKHAVEMDPDNMAYQTLYRQLQSGGQWYSGRGRQYGRTTINPAGYCMSLLCLNLCCSPYCGVRFC